jgi:hypothetical protein
MFCSIAFGAAASGLDGVPSDGECAGARMIELSIVSLFSEYKTDVSSTGESFAVLYCTIF